MQPMRETRSTHGLSIVTLLSVATAVIISGCATPYKEPTGESIASIEFINEFSQPMSIFVYGDSRECTDRVDAGLVQPKTQRSLRVPAGQELVISVGWYTSTPAENLGGALGALIVLATLPKGCISTTTIDFLPEVGRIYVFRINSDGKDCSYQFFARPSANQRPDEVVPVAFTKRKWIQAFDESGPFCTKK